MTLRLTPDAKPSRPDLVLDATDAIALIDAGSTVAVGGSGSLLQVPETLLSALETRWLAESTPAELTVLHVMGLGDHTGRGIDHVAIPGLVTRFVGSHFVLSPREQAAIRDGEVEAIGLPAGTISLLYREIAAGRPGLVTDIGLETFVDPRQQWGRLNARTTSGLSELIELAGREWLFYPSFPIDVALLRASEADEHGNISMDDEAALSDNLAIAQAVHNSGGLVVVEVKRIVAGGSIPATHVRVPGALVNHVVLTDAPIQTPITDEDERRTGVLRNVATEVPALQLDHRKVVARRALTEIHEGDLANLGVGMANGISYVALEEGVLDRFTLSVEQGIFGGLPGVGLDSGTAVNPTAIVDMPGQFDLYDGGGLDFAGLAFAQIDRAGNVNVTAVGGVPIGPGGFIDISQKTPTVVFCGTFRGGALRTRVDAGRLEIEQEGRYPKLVVEVEYVTFNAARAVRQGQQVFYITERAVFRLTPAGIELIEIAPGIDLERDVIGQMGFVPLVSPELRTMDAAMFGAEALGIRLQAPRAARAGSRRLRKLVGS